MTPLLRVRTSPRLARILIGAALAVTVVAPRSLDAQATRSRIANDPDVLGAERLFSAWMNGQIAYRGLPGIAVGVVSDQDLVWSAGFGYANVAEKTPMTPTTKFRMASHSKMFAAIAIMQLREQGKLRLDDPVSQYLPWFKAKPAGDDDGPITIEQLLSHSSGLQREAGDHWTSYNFPTADELRRLYADRQAAFAPSVRWKYSNLGYAIDSHYHDQVDDVITTPWTYRDGAFELPTGPGLGVELDRDKLAFYHRYFLEHPEVNEFFDPRRPDWVPALPLF